MNIQELNRVFLIGIGGIGMSSLARYFRQHGATVSGYDKADTPLTKTLQEEGMHITFQDDTTGISLQQDLVIYTPAIPKDNTILQAFMATGLPVLKRSEVLQKITESYFSITVAGTHGKTTISTMIAYLLRETGYGCEAFLGGISSNYNSNYWSSEEQRTAVIEADEYDRSFLRLRPDIAVLSAMDADHLDIYGTVEEMEKAFIQYTQNIKPDGLLLHKHGLAQTAELHGANKLSYSLQNSAADCYAANIVQKDGGYLLDIIGKGWIVNGLHLHLGGMHNVENLVAAVAVAKQLEIDSNAIRSALQNFKGVKRRFEYIIKNKLVVFIDDYAHHPEELSALIRSAKRLFPKRKCVVAFQPHLFSRTRDLATGFASSLDLADETILLDIYPARELPIEGVTVALIKQAMQTPVTILSKEGLINYIAAARPELFITAGAGDIDQLVQPIKNILDNLG